MRMPNDGDIPARKVLVSDRQIEQRYRRGLLRIMVVERHLYAERAALASLDRAHIYTLPHQGSHRGRIPRTQRCRAGKRAV